MEKMGVRFLLRAVAALMLFLHTGSTSHDLEFLPRGSGSLSHQGAQRIALLNQSSLELKHLSEWLESITDVQVNNESLTANATPVPKYAPQMCNGVGCYIVDVAVDSLRPRIVFVTLGLPFHDMIGYPNRSSVQDIQFIDIRTNKTAHVAAALNHLDTGPRSMYSVATLAGNHRGNYSCQQATHWSTMGCAVEASVFLCEMDATFPYEAVRSGELSVTVTVRAPYTL